MDFNKIQFTSTPITNYSISLQRFIKKIVSLQLKTSPKHQIKNYSQEDMEIQRFLFGFNPSAVVEDVALITLEKTAPRLELPIKSYGLLKFQPPNCQFSANSALK